MLMINREFGQGQGNGFAPFATLENGLGSGDRRIEPAYRDHPEDDQHIVGDETDGQADNQRLEAGPTVQPSRLHGEGSEWR